MRVLLLAEQDNGQQNFLLAKAMRDYLGWDAKSIVHRESYLEFKTDWTTKKNTEEAAEFAKTADLFILQDSLFVIDGIEIQKLAGYKNTIVTGTGSKMRGLLEETLGNQLAGWPTVAPISDETIASHLLAAPFENVIVPVEEILEIVKGIEKRDDIVSVCHAPTKKGTKGTEKIESILRPLIDAGTIAYTRIENMTWCEALVEKAKHHIIIDAIGNVTYTYGAGNALEGLVLGQTVISKISPWAYALHPDLPMDTTWKNNEEKAIHEAIVYLEGQLKHGGAELKEDNEWQLEWVTQHFAASNQIEKWANYINWVQTRE